MGFAGPARLRKTKENATAGAGRLGIGHDQAERKQKESGNREEILETGSGRQDQKFADQSQQRTRQARVEESPAHEVRPRK